MENAVEALKIAFAVILFVLALTVSISSFSQVNASVTSIVNMKEIESQYGQVKPANSLTRIVGIESIIPTMYSAYSQNIEIYFKNADGVTMPIYYKTDAYGRRIKNSSGNEETVNSLNFSKENFSSLEEAIKHLDMILGGYNVSINNPELEDMAKKYEKQFYGDDRNQSFFSEFLSKHQFEEVLGEYSQGSGSTAITRRVITYTAID